MANRTAVNAVQDYHLGLLNSLDAYLAADEEGGKRLNVRIAGLRPVFFERTAWDLDLATEALAH